MIIKPFQAFNGDSILISFQAGDKTVNILVDGGIPRTYRRELKKALEAIKENDEVIDLLIVTHIDDDHIGGIKAMFADAKFDHSMIKKIWFNSGKLMSDHFNTPEDPEREIGIVMSDSTEMSVRQGITLEKELLKSPGWVQNLIFAGYQEAFYGADIFVLSPSEEGLRKLNDHWETEAKDLNMSGNVHDDFGVEIAELVKKDFFEDKATPNGSSIAFMLKQGSGHYLFLGDAHPSVVERSLRALGFSETNKLNATFVKVSHHSSKFNTSPGLLAIIASTHFFISTDGSKHGLPNKEPLARIVTANPGVTLHFNYKPIAGQIFLDGEIKKYGFNVRCQLGTDYIFEN